MRRTIGTAALAGALALAGAAAAHTLYLLPVTFAPGRDYVTVEAGLAETHPFVPDFPIRAAGEYLVTGPDGRITATSPAVQLKEFSAFDAILPAEGTYRISTGERPGRTFTWAMEDGAWRPVRPDNPAPQGAETMQTQAFLKAETYVTRGAPDAGALQPSGKGLEFHPLTHPNELYAGEPFAFVLLSDGQPLAGQPFAISRGGEQYAETRFAHAGKTGADGRAEVVFDHPGAYLIEVHYPERAEGNPKPVPRSVVYSLSFEVTR